VTVAEGSTTACGGAAPAALGRGARPTAPPKEPSAAGIGVGPTPPRGLAGSTTPPGIPPGGTAAAGWVGAAAGSLGRGWRAGAVEAVAPADGRGNRGEAAVLLADGRGCRATDDGPPGSGWRAEAGSATPGAPGIGRRPAASVAPGGARRVPELGAPGSGASGGLPGGSAELGRGASEPDWYQQRILGLHKKKEDLPGAAGF